MEKKYTALINNSIVCDNIYPAETFYEKFKGLMFSSSNSKKILLIKNCNSVHTCFMNYNLNVVCLDKNFIINKIFYDVKPFRFILPKKNVSHILEIPSGCVFDISVGDTIKFIQK